MGSLLRKVEWRLKRLRYRWNYYLHNLLPTPVPFSPLPYLLDGFKVSKVAKTGLRVIDNFCSREECEYLIHIARKSLTKSGVVVDGKAILDKGRSSSHAVVFHRSHQDPKILPIMARGAMLAGVPIDHAEQIYVSRYDPGEFYHGHYDFSNDFMTSDRLCTLLIYLNDLDDTQGGATYFRDLNVAIRPKAGRAVCWTNINPDGSQHRETVHAALPTEGETTEKWVVQIWFRPYRMHKVHQQLQALQTKTGQPVRSGDKLPDGTWTIH